MTCWRLHNMVLPGKPEGGGSGPLFWAGQAAESVHQLQAKRGSVSEAKAGRTLEETLGQENVSFSFEWGMKWWNHLG